MKVIVPPPLAKQWVCEFSPRHTHNEHCLSQSRRFPSLPSMQAHHSPCSCMRALVPNILAVLPLQRRFWCHRILFGAVTCAERRNHSGIQVLRRRFLPHTTPNMSSISLVLSSSALKFRASLCCLLLVMRMISSSIVPRAHMRWT